MRKLSFGQNQGIVWSSDSNLWGNQLLRWENWILDRTKVLHGPWTQTYGETNYLDEKIKFWTEPRYCMVLGLKPMGKPITYQNQVLLRTKVSHGPWTRTYGKVGYLIKILSCLILGSNTRKRLRLWKLLERWWNTLLLSNLEGLFNFGLYVFGWLLPIPHQAFSCHLSYFGVSVVFSGRHYCARQLH